MRRRSLGTVADMPQDSKVGVAGSVPLTKLMVLMYPDSPAIRTDMAKFEGAYNGLIGFVNQYVPSKSLPKATVNLLALTAIKEGARNLSEVRKRTIELARQLISGSSIASGEVRKMMDHMKQLTEIAVARGGLQGRKGSAKPARPSVPMPSVPMPSVRIPSMSTQAFIMDHIQDGIQCANFWLKTLDRKRYPKEIMQLTQIRNALSRYLPVPSQMKKLPMSIPSPIKDFATIPIKPSVPKIGTVMPPQMTTSFTKLADQMKPSVNAQTQNPLTPQNLYRVERLIEQLQNLSMRLVQSEMKHLSMVNSQLQGSNKTVTSLKAKIAELETKCEKIANSKSPTESQILTAKDVTIAKLKAQIASLKKMQSACKQSASVLKKDLRLAEFDLDNLITQDAHPQDIEAKHEEIEAIEKMITQVEDPILVVPEEGVTAPPPMPGLMMGHAAIVDLGDGTYLTGGGPNAKRISHETGLPVSTTAASEEEDGGFFGDFFGTVGEGLDDVIEGGKEIIDIATKTPEELEAEEAALAEEEAALAEAQRKAADTAGKTTKSEESEEESNTMLYVGIGAVLLGGAAWYYTSRNK